MLRLPTSIKRYDDDGDRLGCLNSRYRAAIAALYCTSFHFLSFYYVRFDVYVVPNYMKTLKLVFAFQYVSV